MKASPTLNVCSFSTGLSSAVMTERILVRYGAENTAVVFMDTTIEHEDNYRFMGEVEARWKRVYGFTGIIPLCEGRSPYEVADDEKMVFTQRRAACTRILKIEPFMRWLAQINAPLFPDAVSEIVEKADTLWPEKNKRPSIEVLRLLDCCKPLLQFKGAVTIHIGIDFSEVERKPAIALNYLRIGAAVDFPLLWRPIEYRPYTEVAQRDWGIEPPITYAMGFSHANCLGMDSKGRGGCVKFGVGDRIRQYVHMPDVALKTAEWELSSPGYTEGGYTMLRDQSNGAVTARTLKSVIDDYEAKRTGQLDLFGDGCIHCGIGDFVG